MKFVEQSSDGPSWIDLAEIRAFDVQSAGGGLILATLAPSLITVDRCRVRLSISRSSYQFVFCGSTINLPRRHQA